MRLSTEAWSGLVATLASECLEESFAWGDALNIHFRFLDYLNERLFLVQSAFGLTDPTKELARA